jgi:predicted DNA-binding transcriptional regulator AlpA
MSRSPKTDEMADDDGVGGTAGRTDLEPLAINADGVARLLDISPRHVWALHSSGRLPRPVALGRARRWVISELEEWLAAGCPARDRWESMRSKE